jgi:tetratricopeptide (TPR) repeat protein
VGAVDESSGQGRPDKPPVVLIPVTEEDATRRQRRYRLTVWAAAAIVLGVGGYLYKRWVDPIHARQSYESGVRLYNIARYPQAILAFERVIDLDPNLIDAYLMLGRSCLADSKIDCAIAEFSRTIEKRPTDTQALLGRGRSWLELKDYQAAIQDAERALSIDSRFAAAYNLRGLAVRGLGDPHRALIDFTRAVDLSPESYNFFQRGATYQLLGQHREALADFDRMIAIQPDAAPAYFARAASRLAVGDVEGAERDRRQGRILDGR